jgi:putative sigma-54 modulation protein
MKIEVKGRNLQVTDELRESVARRFEKVGKQVSELAVLEVELCEEKLPGTRYTATAELRVKGTTLRAKDASKDVKHAVNLVADDMARQVKRHRDKRRARRESRALGGAGAPLPPGVAEPGTESLPAL